jgi:hypothetical protein
MAALAKSRFLNGHNVAGMIGVALSLLLLFLLSPAMAEDASDPIALELRKTYDAEGNAPEAIDWEALNWDPWSVTSPAKQPAFKSADPTDSAVKWDQKLNPDGSRALTAKKQLPTALDAKVGADLGVVADVPNYRQPGHLPNGSSQTSSGTAWANVSIPGASIDARLDPSQDQAKLGTTLKKSIPLNSAVSVSVENGYAVTDSYASVNPAIAPGTPSRIYSTDGIARLTIESTGTTFSTGTTMTTADEKWRRSLGAEQKILGGVNISGAVKETDTGLIDKTFSAGFKKSW